MIEHQQQRVEDFRREVAEMRLRDPATGRDRTLLRLGIVLMVVGVAAGIVAYVGSHGSDNPLEQRDYLVTAVAGASVTFVGAALFVRASLAQFLRFWLARLSYEQQTQTDRLVAALSPATTDPDPTVPTV